MTLDYPAMIKSARERLGLSQSALAHAAGVSLPSIQNLEAGRANPGIKLLEPVFSVLGLTISVQAAPADWDQLAFCGVPLTSHARPRRAPIMIRPTGSRLVQLLGLAASELSHVAPTAESTRKREAIAATLVAIQDYYPTFYRKHCARVPALRDLLPSDPARLDGRLIKLKRLALARISEYL
jgi:transcriptional regulator with XRE-family HTH domain